MKSAVAAGAKFETVFRQSTIDHLLSDYSETEVGFRHPHGPVGCMARDGGMLDLYSGPSRIIMTVGGNVMVMGKRFGVASEYILFKPRSIETLTILGKRFNRDVFNGKRVVTQEQPLTGLQVIGPATVVVGNKIVGTVPLDKVFGSVTVFDTDAPLKPVEVEKFEVLEGMLKKVRT